MFKHNHPLLLIGADILKLGQPQPQIPGYGQCVFRGITGEYNSDGDLAAMMTFDVDVERHGVPLLWCSRKRCGTFRVAGRY